MKGMTLLTKVGKNWKVLFILFSISFIILGSLTAVVRPYPNTGSAKQQQDDLVYKTQLRYHVDNNSLQITTTIELISADATWFISNSNQTVMTIEVDYYPIDVLTGPFHHDNLTVNPSSGYLELKRVFTYQPTSDHQLTKIIIQPGELGGNNLSLEVRTGPGTTFIHHLLNWLMILSWVGSQLLLVTRRYPFEQEWFEELGQNPEHFPKTINYFDRFNYFFSHRDMLTFSLFGHQLKSHEKIVLLLFHLIFVVRIFVENTYRHGNVQYILKNTGLYLLTFLLVAVWLTVGIVLVQIALAMLTTKAQTHKKVKRYTHLYLGLLPIQQLFILVVAIPQPFFQTYIFLILWLFFNYLSYTTLLGKGNTDNKLTLLVVEIVLAFIATQIPYLNNMPAGWSLFTFIT